MSKGIYVATSGSLAQLRHMELLANNLANARTSGFKSDRMSFEEVLAGERAAANGGGVRGESRAGRRPDEVDKRYVQARGAPSDMGPGALTQTDNPLDVAVTGNLMLEVETRNGVRLTRGGRLVLGRDGTLMTNAGNPVLSDKGKRIVVPPDQVPEIDADGRIHTEHGEVARLGLASPDLGKGLVKDPSGLFMRAPDVKPSADAQVMQGHIEESNVSPVRVMLELINVQRTFSALRQVITTSGELDAAAARLPR